MSALGPFLDEECTRYKMCYKTKDFCTIHIDAPHRLMTPIGAPQPHLYQIPSVYKQFACEMVRSAEELFAIEKMAALGMSIKQITEAVFSSSTEMTDRIVPVKDTVQKHVINLSFDTP